MNFKELDYYMREALKYLRDSDNPKKGVVVASLIDQGNVVYATSELNGKGKWVHAERNVLELYLKKHGFPSDDSTMIVSLSPCIKSSNLREGDSCSNLLLGRDIKHPKIKIKKIHVGIIDKLQGNLRTYEELGFELTMPQDSSINLACKELFNYFLPKNYGKISIPDFLNKILKDL